LPDNPNTMQRFIVPVYFLLMSYTIDAQALFTSADPNQKEQNSTILESQTDYLKKIYFQKVDHVDELVNGRDYNTYYFRSKSKPLLNYSRKMKSYLLLKGRKYDNLSLEYDTFRDELIYSDTSRFIDNKMFRIALNEDLIEEFCFYSGKDSLKFRYFKPDEAFNLNEGFYEVVYDGRSKLLIRHKSMLTEKEGKIEYLYSPEDYIKVNSGYSKIKGSSGFRRLFGEKSAEMKKFIHGNRVHFRSADKYQKASVLRYYDSLVSSDKN
jgi:hypothetical protein